MLLKRVAHFLLCKRPRNNEFCSMFLTPPAPVRPVACVLDEMNKDPHSKICV